MKVLHSTTMTACSHAAKCFVIFYCHNLPSSLSKQPPHPLQHAILLRIVWMIFTWYFQDSGERFRIRIYRPSNSLGDLQRVVSKDIAIQYAAYGHVG